MDKITKTEQEWREHLAARNAEPLAYAVTRQAARWSRHSCSVLVILSMESLMRNS